MKYLIKLIVVITISMHCVSASAQAIANIETTIIKNDSGNVVLEIKPLVWDMTAPKPTKSFEVYATLVCYTYKGEQKALHQDLTYDFEKKGRSEKFLAYGATMDNIVIGEVLFYRRDEVPADQRPKKADCFK